MARIAVRLFVACVLFSLITVAGFAQAPPPGVVTRTDDPADPAPTGTLRWAIEQRNGCTGGCVPITFNIPVALCPLAECQILINRALPPLQGTPGYVIDGLTQQTFNGKGVLIDGTAAGSDGLVANTSTVTIKDLSIGGFSGAGIRLATLGTGALLENLQIGFGLNGSPFNPLPNGIGIVVDSGVSSAIIRFTRVFGNLGDGIQIGTSVADLITGIDLRSSTFGGNGGLGIDIAPDGPNPNDLNDLDLGPNGLQNTPVITSATWLDRGTLQVAGTLDGAVPFGTYVIEIFEADPADPEGPSRAFFQTYPADAAGDVTFNETVTLTLSPPLGALTATATESDSYFGVNETSEFSAPFPIQLECTVTNTNDSGPGSLREAIQQANSALCMDIVFNIPGAGPTFVIQPLTPLEALLLSGLIIDGRTQAANNGDTNPSGPEIVLNGSNLATGHGLFVDSEAAPSGFVDGVEIRGLVIQSFPGDGIRIDGGTAGSGGHLIEECFIGTNAAATADAGNGGNGVGLFGAVSSTFIGANPLIGTGGNVISGNGGFGIFAGVLSGNNDFTANVIGADKTGTSPIPNDAGGMYFATSFSSLGFSGRFTPRSDPPAEALAARPVLRKALERRAALAERAAAEATRSNDERVASASIAPMTLPSPSGNIIAFNGSHGITLDLGANNNLIVLNWIHSNNGDGVHLTTTAGDDNTIEQNSIEINVGLGINIVPGATSSATEDPNGVLINDGQELFGNPNDEVDYPTILDAIYDGSNTTITYTFASSAGAYSTYDFNFYSSPVADPSGFGEGEFHLVSDSQTYAIAPPNGSQVHTVALPMDLRGLWLTATTTNPSGSTSEFSSAFLVRAQDLGISKTGFANAFIGIPMVYTLTVQNFGPDAANVVVTDNLPVGSVFNGVSAFSTNGTVWTCGEVAGVVTCTTPTMIDSDVTTITINVFAPSAPGPATNIASVSTTSPDLDSTNDNTSFVTNVTSAELAIGKTASPDPVRVGQTLTYTISVTNSGSAAATNIQLNDALDPSVTFVSAGNAAWSCTPSGFNVLCSFIGGTPAGSLPTGGSTTFPIVVIPTAAGSISNSATVVTEVPEMVNTDNSTSIVTTVAPAQSDLSLTKTGPASVAPGAPISWTLTVTNSGPDDAASVVVTDTLPAGATFQAAGSSAGCAFSGTSGGSQIVTCTAASLVNGGTVVFTIAATAPTATGPATNSATVSSSSSDLLPANNTTSFTTNVAAAGADLKLDKTGPLSAEPGSTFSYILTVTNLGPSSVSDATVTDFIPSGMTYLDAPDPDWLCSESSPGIVTCSLLTGPLTSGASSSFSLTVLAPATQTSLTNIASVSSTTPDPNTTNNDAAATTNFTSPCPAEPPILVAPAPGASDVGSPVLFRWLAVHDAIGYQVMIIPENGASRAIGTVDGSAPEGDEMSLQAPVPPGRIIWWVRALFGFGCTLVDSAQQVFFSSPCPSEAPTLLEVAEGLNGQVTLRWTRVPEALRYHVLLARDDGPYEPVGSVEQVPAESTLSFTTVVPAGSDIGWIIEVEFGGGCPRLRSAPGEFEAPCYPPVLSIPGMVTSDREYQVRATIVSVGRTYLFEESTSPLFDRNIVTKQGLLDPDGEYIFAIFEHPATEPTPYYYRARVNQSGCQFSGSGRIVVIPPSNDIVLQLGLEETTIRQFEVLSPQAEEGTVFSFEVVDDRDWILNVTPSVGTILPNEVLVLTVTIDPLGLLVGTTTGTIEVEFTPIAPAGKNAQSNHSIKTSTTVSVTLVTPVTNKGKGTPEPESLIVPAVAHADGFNSQWQSDIRLVNLGTADQKYALNFTLSGENGTQTGKSAEVDLSPGQTTALNDIVRQWFGLGALPAENATGVFEIRPLARGAISINQTSVTKTLVSVASSRTFNKTALGTLGQFIPGIPFAGFVGTTPPEAAAKTILSLQQLAQNDAYRTNVGLAEASGNPANVTIRFYDAEGTKLLEVPVALQAGEHLQFNEILKKNGITDLDTGRAEVEVLGGDGRITAYASVVDNQTNDPLLVQAVNLAEIGAAKYVVPGLAHFETGQARWRSDMQIFNSDTVPVAATLVFYRLGETTPAETVQVTVEPGTILTLGNVVSTLFGETDTGGSVHISTVGTSKLVVTARTYDQTDAGTYGQFIPAVTEAQAFGLGDRPMQVLQMEESANFRTNLGIVEITGAPVQVELTAHVAESRVTPRVQLTIQGNEFRQLNQVLKSLNVGNTYNTRVALRVTGGQGKIVAYGSAVDNKTQDPTYVPGQ